MAEEVVSPVVRRIYETTAFDPERGAYRAVVIRVEFPPGQFHDITVPKSEYDPNKVPEYVKAWLENFGRWVGQKVSV